MAESADRRRNSGGRFRGCSVGSIKFFFPDEEECVTLGKVRLFLLLAVGRRSSFSLRDADDADFEECDFLNDGGGSEIS